MRLLLLFLALCGFMATQAQPPIAYSFWQVMPDSMHQQRLLKNWKLNGPVKTIIIASYSEFEMIARSESTPPEYWDENTLYSLQRKFQDGSYDYDTVKFSEKGEVKKWAFCESYKNYMGLASGVSIKWNELGYPVKILNATNGDSLAFYYDTVGGLLYSVEYSPGRSVNYRYEWDYSDSCSTVKVYTCTGKCHLERITNLYYNTNGQLIKEETWLTLEKEEKQGDDILKGPFVFEQRIYNYNELNQLNVLIDYGLQFFEPSSYSVKSNSIADSIAFKVIPTVDSFFYNEVGLLTEKRTTSLRGQNDGIFERLFYPSPKKTTVYTYNAKGWLISQLEYEILNEEKRELSKNKELRYEFDKYGNPTRILLKDCALPDPQYRDYNGRSCLYSENIIKYEYY